jgi:molybdopterin-guanine dinucleotide biosynthesis protein A
LSAGTGERLDGLRSEALTGLILCAGRGRRMSADGHGVDKGLMPLLGRPLLEHVIDRLRPQVNELLLNAPDLPPWRAFGLPLVPDRIAGGLGPLAGLHAGLRAAPTRWVLCVPCDTPLLPLDLAARMRARLDASPARCVLASCAGQAHPVIALIEAGLAAHLEDWLAGGGRSIGAWLEAAGAATCEFNDPAAFTNLNTPDELRRLEHRR